MAILDVGWDKSLSIANGNNNEIVGFWWAWKYAFIWICLYECWVKSIMDRIEKVRKIVDEKDLICTAIYHHSDKSMVHDWLDKVVWL